MAVFNQLKMVDLQGAPTLGTICRPWITDFASTLFGSYNAATGRRLISESLVMVPKKSGKSSIAAGVMMTALIRNWRHSAQFLIIAPTVEVANNSFGPAQDMVRADDELCALFHVQDHLRTITNRTNGAMLKVVAAENETVAGIKATGVLCDELHVFSGRAGAENMFREAMGGLASRPEGFVIYLTTQSDGPPAGVFKQKLDYARGVRDGRIKDLKFLPLLYEFPAKMIESGECTKKSNLWITNPNLGASVDEEFLIREFAKAEESGRESMQGFLAKHANVETGLGLRSNNWSGARFWESCGDHGLTLESLLKRSEVVTVGIDGGGLDDMLGLAAIGREIGTGKWLHWAHAWIHPIVLEIRKQEAARFRDFESQGDLTIVDTIGRDIEHLVDYVSQIEDSGLMDRVGVDQAGIGSIVDALTDQAGPALALDRIMGIPQGWRMVGAIKTVERKLAEGNLRHGARKMMAWCVGNAKVEARGNAIIITKQIAGSAKIDPLMATFDAASLMSQNPTARNKRFQFFTV